MVTGLGATTPGAAAGEFRIGCALPLTGAYGKTGQLVRDAYTFWAEHINYDGGISGKYPVRLVFHDDRSNPQKSAKLVERLITQDKVDLILGSCGSSSVMAASAVAARHQYPYPSSCAASEKIFQQHNRYYFSTQSSATKEVGACVALFEGVSPKPKSVAIVGTNIPSAMEACAGFREYAHHYGFKIVHFELFPVMLKDYNTILLKAKAKKPDLLLVGCHLESALKVMKAIKEIDFNPKAVVFSHGPAAPAFRLGLKARANYAFAPSAWTPNLPYKGAVFGSAREFSDAYEKRFGRAPEYMEAASIAAALALQKGLEALNLKPGLGQDGRIRLTEKLHAMDLMTFYGPVRFGPDGDNQGHTPVAVQVQDQRLVNVFPAKWAERKPLYPMPAWKNRK